jgi:uncharacterized tellurite resistance protein B-like protein
MAHFTAIVNLATIDGTINSEEEKILKGFARKLEIDPEEYKSILKHPGKYPLMPINSSEERLKHLYDLFEMIYADHEIDASEKILIVKYAIGLGVPLDRADAIIERSIQIFEGQLNFYDYQYLMKK